MIWAFFSRRIRLWLLFAIGVPIVRRLLGSAGETLEARKGESSVSRGLRASSQHLTRYERGARKDAKRAPRRLTR